LNLRATVFVARVDTSEKSSVWGPARDYSWATAQGPVKTMITAQISIESAAWRRVIELAAQQGRSLPEVLGELLDQASAEPTPQAPKVDTAYEPPALLRLWLRKHPDTVVERD